MCRSEQAYVLLNERSNQRAQCICHLSRLRMRLLRERDSAHCSHCSLRGCCCQIRPPPRLEEQLLSFPVRAVSPFVRHWKYFYGGLPCCLLACDRKASHIFEFFCDSLFMLCWFLCSSPTCIQLRTITYMYTCMCALALVK